VEQQKYLRANKVAGNVASRHGYMTGVLVVPAPPSAGGIRTKAGGCVNDAANVEACLQSKAA
jgi:hypothetical protein